MSSNAYNIKTAQIPEVSQGSIFEILAYRFCDYYDIFDFHDETVVNFKTLLGHALEERADENLQAVAKRAPEKKEKKLRKKKEKLPGQPTRGKTAFFFFSDEMRAKVKAELEEERSDETKKIRATEMTTRLGEMWSELDEDAKKKYKDLADADKERYKREKEIFDAKQTATTDSEAEPVEKPKRSRKKKTDKPAEDKTAVDKPKRNRKKKE